MGRYQGKGRQVGSRRLHWPFTVPAGHRQGREGSELALPESPADPVGGYGVVLEVSVASGGEAEVMDPGVERAGAGEEQIGECVADGRQTQIATGVTLAQDGDILRHSAVVFLRVVCPGERRP